MFHVLAGATAKGRHRAWACVGALTAMKINWGRLLPILAADVPVPEGNGGLSRGRIRRFAHVLEAIGHA